MYNPGVNQPFAKPNVRNSELFPYNIGQFLPAKDLLFQQELPQRFDFKLDLAPFIQYGASPRATLYLTLAAKAHAFLQNRGYVTPQDVKSIGPDVLRHRVIVTYEAEAEEISADTIVRRLFDGLPVP